MKFYPTYLQSLGLLLILLLCSILSTLLVLPFYSIESVMGISLVYALSLVATIVVALFIRQQISFPRKAFAAKLIFVGSVTIMSLHLFLDPVTSLIPLPDSLAKMFRETIQHPVAFFGLIVIAAPVLEELLFRGIILDGFLKNYQPYKAAGVSAFLFALVHGNLAQGIGAFLIGLLIGWLYWKTESVIPGILIHLINNLAAYLAIVFSDEEDLLKNFSEQLGNPLLYWLLVAAGGLISALGIWWLNSYFSDKRVKIAIEN